LSFKGPLYSLFFNLGDLYLIGGKVQQTEAYNILSFLIHLQLNL